MRTVERLSDHHGKHEYVEGGQLNDEMQGYLDNMLEARVQTMGYLDAIAIIDKDRRVAACGAQHEVYDAVELTCEKLMDMADHAMYQMKNVRKHGHVILEYSEKAGSREV